MALRHRFVYDRPVQKLVPLDCRDLVEVLGQHTSSEQARDAGSDDNGMLPKLPHHDGGASGQRTKTDVIPRFIPNVDKRTTQRLFGRRWKRCEWRTTAL